VQKVFGELTSYPLEARKERKWLSLNLLKSEIPKRIKGSAKIPVVDLVSQDAGRCQLRQRC
jgi:hypothetical protein